jgi:hypothetical protein
MTTRDEEDLIEKLNRAHKMTISGPGVAGNATTYGAAALALKKAYQERDEALEALRDKSNDAREASEQRSWSKLVPERFLYPDYFELMGTSTGAATHGRLSGNRIYVRHFSGLLQPIPGQVWRRETGGTLYLVLATAEYRHHAVVDVEEFTGPIPEAGEEH